MIPLNEIEEMYEEDISRASEWIPDLIQEIKQLRQQLAHYEQYEICHPDGTHCCDECLERNGFEVQKNDDTE